MKPLRLSMRAFGPYADEQTLDFSALADRTFFLIHGPTGAGKSSILDAMCFALYGDTSGAERDARQMRSDHADPRVATEVVFDFALGSDIYRVARKPEHERAKLRGEGKTKQPAEATLWRRTGCPDDQEGEVLESKSSRVTGEIERLTGFSAAEFRQVVMLPQGQFRKLLMADSNEREKILETLFKTDLYRRIQDELKKARLALEGEAKRLTTRKEVLLEEAGAQSRAELAARKEERAASRDALVTETEGARERRDATRRDFESAKATAVRIDALAAAKRALESIEARRPQIEGVRDRVSKARRAGRLRELLGIRERTQALADKDAAAAAEAAAAVERTRTRAAETVASLEREQARTPEHETARAELQKLRSLTGKAEELKLAVAERDGIERTIAALDARGTELAGSIEALTIQSRELAEAFTHTKLVALQSDARRTVLAEAERQQSWRRKLDSARGRRAEAQQDTVVATAEVDAANRRHRLGIETLEALRTAWEAGQAVVLARALEAGKPCPVCGSAEHPAPATAGPEVPTDAELQKQRALCAELEAAVEASRARLRSREELARTTGAEVEALVEQLGDLADTAAQQLDGRVAEAGRALKEADDARAELDALERKRADVDGRLQALQRDKAGLDSERSAVLERRATARAAVERAERELPANLRDATTLATTIAAAQGQLDELARRLETARKEHAEADRTAAAATAHDESARRAAERSHLECEQAATRLAEALEVEDFTDENALRNALLSDVEIDGLDAEVQRFTEEHSDKKARVQQLEEQTTGLDRPDLSALEQAAVAAERSHDDLIARRTALDDEVRRIDDRIKRLDAIDEESGGLQQRYAVVGRIATLADGGNEHGVPFHRFVLTALLDDVLQAATMRLSIMSNQRYLLERSTERGSKRRTTGLELDVYDAYTGSSRPVATLSGGESFLASLSLALGLADVVQAYAGGIRLDAIFVDEGFGTLDPESLELALRALLDLQQGGRLVGIISHVPELKERIDARLEVTTTRRGSTARFVVV